MRIEGIPGKYGFKALYNYNGTWELTNHYFFTKEEVDAFFKTVLQHPYLWPVEAEQDGQYVYVPHPTELED